MWRVDVTLLVFVKFLGGLALLAAGASWLVRGAARVAEALGAPPLIIGLTVVAYGTSAPELAVSVEASLGGAAEIALGNVVGSNIFNVLFILGISALVAPLSVDRSLLRRDVWIMIGVSGLVWVLALDGGVGRTEGLLLAAGAIAYTLWLVGAARAGARASGAPCGDHLRRAGLTREVLRMAVGLAALTIGAGWLVEGAVSLARSAGVTELVVGLTIVAAGTSFPELATSAVAAWRGQRDLAVGNVIGSNIFNLLAVLGVSAMTAPNGTPVAAAALRLDIPVMAASAVACAPVFLTRRQVDRWEAALFLLAYAAYTAYRVAGAP